MSSEKAVAPITYPFQSAVHITSLCLLLTLPRSLDMDVTRRRKLDVEQPAGNRIAFGFARLCKCTGQINHDDFFMPLETLGTYDAAFCEDPRRQETHIQWHSMFILVRG